MSIPDTLYRYIDQQFIEKFFATGELQVSTVSAFAKLEHAGQDDHEGQVTFTGLVQLCPEAPDGQTLYAFDQIGSHAYILSLSSRDDPALMETFHADGYFAIRDVFSFAAALTDALHFQANVLRELYLAACTYVDHRTVRRDGLPHVDLNANGEINDESAVTNQIRLAMGVDPLLLKPRGHEPQAEWRLIWAAPEPTERPYIVTCPEAIQYCERITHA